MRLLVTTPTQVVVDHGDMVSLRAEDESGSFGILKGHCDLLTALTISIVAWRRADGSEHFCAVRRGVLSVRGGEEVAIATREAIANDDLDELENVVLARLHQGAEGEREARTRAMRLHMKAIRQIVKYLRPARPGTLEGGS